MILEDAVPVGTTAASDVAAVDAGPLTVGTLIRFLFGSSDAIWRVARTKHGWLLGAVFVLSAGLAREYDRSDLRSEPYHLLIPFAASLISSLLLYGFVKLFAAAKATGPQPSFLEFLQTYWATAPLAWLYALPVEHWWNAADAVAANFWLLGIVAVWRVALMVRTVQTLWGADAWSSAAIVCAFGDLVLILALWLSPVPVLDVMSGNRLSPAELVLQSTYIQVTFLAWLSLPIWLMGLALAGGSAKWPLADRVKGAGTVAATAWGTAIGAIIIGGLLCCREQPRWRNSTSIQRLVAQEDYRTAIARLTRLTPNDFPPHWELPPNVNYAYDPAEPRRLVRFFLAALKRPETAAWVRTGLQEKIIRGFVSPYLGQQMVAALADDDLELLISVLEAADASGEKFPYSGHGIPRHDPQEDPHRAELLKRLEIIYQRESRR